jgi:hypothetical protein
MIKDIPFGLSQLQFIILIFFSILCIHYLIVIFYDRLFNPSPYDTYGDAVESFQDLSGNNAVSANAVSANAVSANAASANAANESG